MLIKPKRSKLITRRGLLISATALAIAAPAVIIPGKSLAWQSFGAANGRYPIPIEVQEKGYNTTTKFDDFDNPATVDINNTQTSGFNWYVQSYFAGASYANPAPPWGALSPSDFAFANSALEIKTDISGFAEGLISTVDNNVPLAMRSMPLPGDSDGPYYSTDPMAFKGWAIKNGAYVDFAISFDPTPFQSTISPWISVWSQPQSFLTGADQQGGGINNRIYTEWDGFEAMLWINPTFALNAWNNPRPCCGSSSFTTNSNARIALPSVNWNNINVIGAFWCPMSDNGGTGFMHRYVNNERIGALDVTWTSGQIFSNLDTQLNAWILGAGVNHSLFVHWFRVTQKSTADIVIQ